LLTCAAAAAIVVSTYASVAISVHDPAIGLPAVIALAAILVAATVAGLGLAVANDMSRTAQARAAKRKADEEYQEANTTRLERLEATLETSADLRYAGLHGVLYGLRSGMQEIARRFEAMDAPTVVLPRPQQLAVVGRATPVDESVLPGYARGYADGLARQPMAGDAKVIPLERS
jgi:hypothetical protein